MRRVLLSLVVFVLAATRIQAEEAPWLVGLARANITPKKPIWMAGYAGRTKPAEGKEHDLWIKVFAFQDSRGQKAVLLTSDLLGFNKLIYDDVCRRVEKNWQLQRSQIVLSSSHTHCGPVLTTALRDIYPVNSEQQKDIDDYTTELVNTIVTTIGSALTTMKPARLSVCQGTARFAVNRRTNVEAKVVFGSQTAGPNDHTVPVLKVASQSGALLAVIFGYACHNTTLSYQKYCGDYAGFAQIELERRRPGADALFFSGCGADQNPLPRRTVELCQRYGAELADAVDDALKRPEPPLAATLSHAFALVPLHYDAAPTREQLQKIAGPGADYMQRWAKRHLAILDAGQELPREHPYPIVAWKLDKHLWISLGGEVVVDYSLRLKREHGSKTWVTAYANDVMAYIPSQRVWQEGGYEGATSMFAYGAPAFRWAPDVEDRVIAGVQTAIARLQNAK